MQIKSLIFLSMLIFIASGSYFEDIQSLMDDYANCPNLQLVGNALVVIKNGQTIYKQVNGLRDLENGLPVTNDTVFAIGSVSKQFTTLLLGQLYEEGLIDFDAPVRNYIPELELIDDKAAAEVTLHDLLTHHSGLARNDWLIFLNTVTTSDQLLSKLKTFPFSTGFRYQATYSTWGYVIARIVIERVTGETYEDALTSRVLAPLGMTTSYATLDETLRLNSHNYAYPHALKSINGSLSAVNILPKDVNRVFDGLVSNAGGVHLSISDLEKYLTAIQTSTIPSLTSSTLKLVTSQKAKSVAPRTLDLTIPFGLYFNLYAYGFMNGEYHGTKYVAHNGGTIGHSTYFLTFPSEKISIGLMTNNLGINFVSYSLLFTQIFDIISGNDRDNSSTCLFSNGGVLYPMNNYPSATISNRDKYTGSFYNSVYGQIAIYPAENDNELYLVFGPFSGKLRSTGTNKFLWFTENSFEGDSLTFTFYFNQAGIKATSLSVSLDHTVPEFVFDKKRSL